jgi:hypothetical protein
MGIDYNIRFDNIINGGLKAYTCGCVAGPGQMFETQHYYNGHMVRAAKHSELYQHGVSQLSSCYKVKSKAVSVLN